MEKFHTNEQIEMGHKPNSYKELLEKVKEFPVDAVVVLSGGVKKVLKRPGEKANAVAGVDITDEPLGENEYARLSSTSYADAGAGAGKAKDLAGFELAKELPKVQGKEPVIVTSSQAPNNKTETPDSQVSEDFLRRRGAGNEIVQQNTSIDTFTELLETLRLAHEKGWKHVAVAVVETQSKRVGAMVDTFLHLGSPSEIKKIEGMMAYNANRFSRDKMPARYQDLLHYNESLEYLKQHKPDVEVTIVIAEDVLKDRDPKHYGHFLEKLRSEADYEKKLEQDENDAQRWVSGQYSAAGDEYIEKWKKRELP